MIPTVDNQGGGGAGEHHHLMRVNAVVDTATLIQLLSNAPVRADAMNRDSAGREIVAVQYITARGIHAHVDGPTRQRFGLTQRTEHATRSGFDRECTDVVVVRYDSRTPVARA